MFIHILMFLGSVLKMMNANVNLNLNIDDLEIADDLTDAINSPKVYLIINSFEHI